MTEPTRTGTTRAWSKAPVIDLLRLRHPGTSSERQQPSRFTRQRQLTLLMTFDGDFGTTGPWRSGHSTR